MVISSIFVVYRPKKEGNYSQEIHIRSRCVIGEESNILIKKRKVDQTVANRVGIRLQTELIPKVTIDNLIQKKVPN
jgi:hypothetical protein